MKSGFWELSGQKKMSEGLARAIILKSVDKISKD